MFLETIDWTLVPSKPGIYKITNTENNKVYIGESINIRDRWKDHISRLRNNNHRNKHLQTSYNKYGESIFLIEVIRIMDDIIELKRVESHYIKEYNSFDNKYGYNKTYTDDDKTFFTEDTLLKLSEINSGSNNPQWGKDGYWKGKNIPADVRTKISETLKGRFTGENHHNYGKPGTMLGKTQSEETKEKIGKSNRGKKRDKDTKILMSQKKDRYKKPIQIDNIVYSCAREASEKLNIKIQNIRYRLKSDSFPNYCSLVH